MKFTCSVEINKPIDYVVEQFINPDSLKYCQKGFKYIEHLSGNKGSAGAKSKLVYEKFELEETIITNNLPEDFFARYEHKHMVNTMKVKFTPLNDTNTHYISEIEYTKFIGLIPKLMAKLFPNLFKKQVLKWMEKFKVYVENTDN